MSAFFAFLIYSFIFLCIGGSVITYYFDVSPFACFSWSTNELFINPFSDWHRLYVDFLHDNWAINSFENLIIFFIFLFFFPAWIGLWFLIRGIKWSKFFSKPVYAFKRRFGKKQEFKMPDVSNLAKTSTERPMAMRKSSNFGNLALMAQEENKAKEKNIDNTSSSAGNTFLNEEKPIPRQPSGSINSQQKEQLRVLGEKYGYELFEKVQMADYIVPFVFATDTVALVTTILMDNKEWIADEEIPEEANEPTWFSAEGLVPSPVFRMTKAAEFLKEKEPDSEIIPVVVIGMGSILNVEAVKDSWKETGAYVVVWNEGMSEGLDTLENLLQEKSQQFEDNDKLSGESPDIASEDTEISNENEDEEAVVELPSEPI